MISQRKKFIGTLLRIRKALDDIDQAKMEGAVRKLLVRKVQSAMDAAKQKINKEPETWEQHVCKHGGGKTIAQGGFLLVPGFDILVLLEDPQ